MTAPEIAHPRTLWLFMSLALAHLLSVVSMNTWVLTDAVYLAIFGEGLRGQAETLLATARRWELVGYVLSPASLFARIGGVALIVQLILLLMGRTVPLARIFRAGVWAQLSLLARALAQLAFLALTPPAGRTPSRLQELPGTALHLVGDMSALEPELRALLDRVTVFDLGWILLFALALENRDRAPALTCLAAVCSAWLLITLTKWGGSLYLARLG